MASTPMTRIFSFPRLAAFLMATAAITLAPAPAYAQEEGPDAPDDTRAGFSSLDVAQPKGTRELQNALQRLALNPADIDALIDGGNAALLLGDPQAAIGFFARAEEMEPSNGRVKAGLGSGLLLTENPYEALRLFEEAKRLGVPETVFASDRGLAYDLVGNSNAAQDNYELALRRGGDDETIRRYALSLGISGDRAAAEAQLDPLLRKRDAAAWRTRAFVLAISGDAPGAIAIADATMPQRMAASIEPFFRSMGRLTPAQQAAAAHFGQFPQSAMMGKDDPRNRQYASAGTPRVRSGRADAGLIPAGEPLGPTADGKARRTAKVDKSQRRRPGRLTKKEREAIALAQAEAAARPVPVQARAPGPVPPSDLLIRGRGTASATVQSVPAASGSSAMVQPLPGAGNRSAMVQPLPRQSDGRATASMASSQAPASLPPAVQQSLPPSRQVQGTQGSAGSGSADLAAAAQSPRPGFSTLNVLSTSQIGRTTVTQAAPAAPPPVTRAPVTADASPTVVASAGQQAASSPVTAAPAPGAFDLARLGSAASPATPAPSVAAPTPTPAPAPTATSPVSPPPATVLAAANTAAPVPQPAATAPAPARINLAAVIASITVPPQELAPDENAVDITKIKPAAPKPPEVKKPEDKKAEAKKAEAKKAAAKPAPPKHPKRYWVQVAGGANRADLAKEWKRLTGESPAVFKGKQGWWTPLNATNRLLTGPFSGPNEAQGFVNTLAKSKLSGFTFTSPEGQEVTKLGG
jgi:Flp pilus assembly protein TadD